MMWEMTWEIVQSFGLLVLGTQLYKAGRWWTQERERLSYWIDTNLEQILRHTDSAQRNTLDLKETVKFLAKRVEALEYDNAVSGKMQPWPTKGPDSEEPSPKYDGKMESIDVEPSGDEYTYSLDDAIKDSQQ